MYNSRREESNYRVAKVSSITRFLLLKTCFAEDVALCFRALATFTTHCIVVLELVNYKRSLMASSVNLHLGNMRRVHVQKKFILNSLHWLFCITITIHLEVKKSFLHPPFILSGHSDIYKAQPSYVCVLTFITLFALQLLAGQIFLVGSEKEEVSKETVHLLLICYKLKLNKQNNQKKKRRTTNIAIKSLFATGSKR